MNSFKWNQMIRMVNDNVPRSEVEKKFSKGDMKIYDSMQSELSELRKTNPQAFFWPVEEDW